MHTNPMSESDGEFGGGWKPTKTERPEFRCSCGSDDVWYRTWGSACGGYEDVKYECRACRRVWWAESSDA